MLDRCEAKREELAKHWQCEESVQNVEDKPWKNEELKKLEEALPRLKEGDLEKNIWIAQSKCSSGVRRIPPESSLGETRKEIVEFLEKVEQSGKLPQQACTTMFFLFPKNVTRERRIALVPTLIRWWEALRAPEVAKWQQKYCVEWDATDGRNGGGQQTLWDILVEMEQWPWSWT